jgi:XRE family transcriptional regulator, fatty acid utilization regulator
MTLQSIAKSTVIAVPADAIRNNGHCTGLFALSSPASKQLPLFSKRFVEIVARAVEEGASRSARSPARPFPSTI